MHSGRVPIMHPITPFRFAIPDFHQLKRPSPEREPEHHLDCVASVSSKLAVLYLEIIRGGSCKVQAVSTLGSREPLGKIRSERSAIAKRHLFFAQLSYPILGTRDQGAL